MEHNLRPLTVVILVASFIGCTLAAAFIGCTRGEYAQLTSFGSPAHVACYSGTLKIYEGDSTGKVGTEKDSDGWFFQEAGTNNLIRVSGSCVVRN